MSEIPSDVRGLHEGYSEEVRAPITALKSGLSPRLAGESSAHIRMLSELEAKLPPILVHRASMRVVDGMHRLRAAILRGDETVSIRFLECGESEVFATAVEMNVKHGLPLSLADRKAAACRILATNSQWSDRKIASITGLSHKTVGALRASAAGENPQLHGRIGRDGRIRQLSTEPGRKKAADLIREEPRKSLREIARSAGVSVGTVRDVRRRMEDGLEPVPESRHAASASAHTADAESRGSLGDRPTALGKDVEAILQSLSKDPSLRLSETGRLLVRLLQTCMACTAKLEVLIAKVPSHQSAAIAQLVRAYADSLSSIARQLERGSPGS